MHSCQALNKIVNKKGHLVDISVLIQKIFPVSVGLFAKTDNPDVLWPMVALISNLITKT